MKRQNVERGERFGRLQVIAEVFDRPRQRRFSLLCDCGKELVAQLAHLKAGRTTSCGCYRREQLSHRAVKSERRKPVRRAVRHGHSEGFGTPEYRTWRAMIDRCYNSKRQAYKYYGGRGIIVCEEWRRDFPAFLAHVGRRPSREYSIDRINVNGNYEPGNVRWADRRTQQLNRRDRKPL